MHMLAVQPTLHGRCCTNSVTARPGVLQDFFCVAWQGADWDGKATADATSGWKPCPSELRYASKDVSTVHSQSKPAPSDDLQPQPTHASAPGRAGRLQASGPRCVSICHLRRHCLDNSQSNFRAGDAHRRQRGPHHAGRAVGPQPGRVHDALPQQRARGQRHVPRLHGAPDSIWHGARPAASLWWFTVC
jgi:hypothetical protein